MIGSLPPTLASRAIHIQLERLAPSEARTIQPYDARRQPYADLARKAARWAADHIDDLRKRDPKMPEELSNRRADNWRAMFAIADLCGGDWPAFAREAALTLEGHDLQGDISMQLLEDIRTVINGEKDIASDRITSAILAKKLGEMEGRPWPEFGHSRKPISPNAIARMLKKFNVVPGNIRDPQDDGTVAKGYWTEVFNTVFERYLPALPL
jgi:hypothetical protein